MQRACFGKNVENRQMKGYKFRRQKPVGPHIMEKKMTIIESLITKAIVEIVKMSAGRGWSSLSRKDKVLKALKKIGLKPGKPEPDFESVYAHALVEYGIDQPEVVLNLFRREDIQKAFQDSFIKKDFSILYNKAAGLIEWNKIGDEIRETTVDLRNEFEAFTLAFNAMVTLTRKPAAIQDTQKLDEVLLLLKNRDQDKIRAKNIEMIQGDLPDQLKAWFKTLGYTNTYYEDQTEKYCEWIVNIPARRRGFDSILVRYMENQAEVDDVQDLISSVKKHAAVEGWLVAAHRTAKSARETAEEDGNVFCYTFDELLDEQADFTKYFEWLEGFVKERHINSEYIPLACSRDIVDKITKEKIDQEIYGKDQGWIEGYINKWLEDPCKEHVSVLGEFGTGKTWFTHHYAYQVMQKYLEAKEKGLNRPRLPLVIQLRDYSKALNSESLFSDFFFRKHEIPLPGYSAFEQLNRMGKLLLIFDGFDEMADKLDRQKMVNNFWELARVVVPGAKAILTCRTEHFPNAKDGRDLLNAEIKASTANLTGDPPQFEVLDLEKFNEDQIKEALLKKTDEKTVDIIMGHPELLDLAGRPVMLDFILEALPEIESGKSVDLSRVYLWALTSKLERDIKSDRTFTSMADKIYFMCELSWEMLTTEKMSINYRLFPDRLKDMFGRKISEEKDLDHWHYDMMGNTLLIRNDDGDYSPAHRSLLEFFVAYKLLAELGLLPEDFTDPARRQSNIDSSTDPEDYTWNSYFFRKINGEDNIEQIPGLNNFKSDNADLALEALGRMGDAVLRFVHEITNTDQVRYGFHGMLKSVLEEFKSGKRDPEKQQDIIRFILKFRRLSQEWEENSGIGDSLRVFWKKHLEKETGIARGVEERKIFALKRSGETPLNIEMVQIPAGSFLMGSDDAGPIHRAKITKPFLISTAPVTQVLYETVIGKNPSKFKGVDRPVETVSWFDAVNFCNKLSIKMRLEPAYTIDGEEVRRNRDTNGFRLLTEAEWEYACRAGTTSAFYSGDLESDLEPVGWYHRNSDGLTHDAGLKNANAWGVFDMHGNVWEWNYDLYREGGVNRVIRGGSWDYDARNCRSAIRNDGRPDYRGNNVGFRLSRSVSLGT